MVGLDSERISVESHQSAYHSPTVSDPKGFSKKGVYVHATRPTLIRTPIAMNPIRIRDIARRLARVKTNPIRPAEPIGDRAHTPRRGIESVDLVWQPRFRAYALLESVDGVGEPDRAVGVDDDVIRGVEGPVVEGCYECLGGRGGRSEWHVYQATGGGERALCAE